ncbi:MAG: hypothetical protein F4X52_12855, partial [Acidimicrobiaceae bacterium]|nr:hypothetical protein [Acidimicrobiaceae bacterium]
MMAGVGGTGSGRPYVIVTVLCAASLFASVLSPGFSPVLGKAPAAAQPAQQSVALPDVDPASIDSIDVGPIAADPVDIEIGSETVVSDAGGSRAVVANRPELAEVDNEIVAADRAADSASGHVEGDLELADGRPPPVADSNGADVGPRPSAQPDVRPTTSAFTTVQVDDTSQVDTSKAVVLIGAVGALSVAEGGVVEYTVRLASAPDDGKSVVVEPSVAVGDDSVVSVSPPSLLFDDSDWFVPQRVSVTGVHDGVDSAGFGVRPASVINEVSSDDPAYMAAYGPGGRTDPVVEVKVSDSQPTLASILYQGKSNVVEGDSVELPLTTAQPNFKGIKVALSRELGVGERVEVPLNIGGLNVTVDDIEKVRVVWHAPFFRVDGDRVAVNGGVTFRHAGVTHSPSVDMSSWNWQSAIYNDAGWTDATSFVLSSLDDLVVVFDAANFGILSDDSDNHPQVREATLALILKDDMVGEGRAETLTVSLGNPQEFAALSGSNVAGGVAPDPNLDSTSVDVADNDKSLWPSSFLVEAYEASAPVGFYTLRLSEDPGDGASVLVDIASADEAVAVARPAQLLFTGGAGGSWDEPQVVRVSGVADNDYEDDTTRLVHTVGGWVGGPVTGPDVTVVVVDRQPGVSVTESDGSTRVSEAGGRGGVDGYQVVLDRHPVGGDVVVTPSTESDRIELSDALTFTADNWNEPQEVVVSALDDGLVNSQDSAMATVSHRVVSGDAEYQGISVVDISVAVIDDDVYGVSVVESQGATVVSDNGDSDTYSLVLDAEPTDPVTVTITSDDPGAALLRTAGSAAAATVILTFNGGPDGNWNVRRFIEVVGVDDDVAQNADRTVTVSHSVVSDDAGYHGFTVDDISVRVLDSDSPGGVIVQSGDSTVVVDNANSSDSYTIALRSEPTVPVTVTVTSEDPDAVLMAVGFSNVFSSSLTFTFTAIDNDWNLPRIVTVEGVEDNLDNEVESRRVLITHQATTPSDTNSLYHGLDIGSVNVQVIDDDPDVGITIWESDLSTIVVDDGEHADDLTVFLDSQPTDPVQIKVVSGNDRLVRVGASQAAEEVLTFTTADWMIPQFVSVSGVKDLVNNAESSRRTSIGFDVESDDGRYKGLTLKPISVSVVDDEEVEIRITLSDASTDVSEDGLIDTYEISLGSQPRGVVEVDLTTPHSKSNGEVWENSPAWVTNGADQPQHPSGHSGGYRRALVVRYKFTPTNWNVPQTATVRGINDNKTNPGGSRTVKIIHTARQFLSGVPGDDYSMVTAEVDVTVFDAGYQEVVVAQSGASTEVSESGGTDVYSVRLVSPPSGEVTVTAQVSADGPVVLLGTGDVSGSSQVGLVFDRRNWRESQQVTVLGLDDAIDQTSGVRRAVISHQAVSTVRGDPYNNISVVSVSVTVLDDDPAPQVIELSADREEIAESAGLTPVKLTATVVGPSRFDSAVQVQVTPAIVSGPGMVAANLDSSVVNITIAAGASTASGVFTVSPVPDSSDQIDAMVTFSGSVSRPGVSLNLPALTVTDSDPTNISLAVTEESLPGFGGSTEITVTLAQPVRPSTTVVVPLVVTGATAGEHYRLELASDASLNAGVVLDTNLPSSVQNPSLLFSGGAQTATLVLTSYPDSVATDRPLSIKFGSDDDILTANVRPILSAMGVLRPVAHWPFDAAADDSAGSNDGVLRGNAAIISTAADVRVGAGALVLDGAGDYVDLTSHVSNLPTGKAARTVTGWFNPANASSQGDTFFDYGSGELGSRITIQADRTAAAIGFNGHFWGLQNLNLAAGWHHIAVTLPENGMSNEARIYVDGIQLKAATIGGAVVTVNTGTSYALIGRRNGGGYYRGSVDDVRVYDQALTAEQIEAIFNEDVVSGSLKHTELDGEQVVLTLSEDAYTASVTTADVTVAGLAGVSVANVVRASDTQLIVTLTDSGNTDFVLAPELVFSVAAVALTDSSVALQAVIAILPQPIIVPPTVPPPPLDTGLVSPGRYRVESPDTTVRVDVVAAEGKLTYSVTRNNKVLIQDSNLTINNNKKHTVNSSELTSHDSEWSTTWGQFSTIRDHHNRLTLNLDVEGIEFDLVFKVFDDGVGFRFIAPAQTDLSGKKFDLFVQYKMEPTFELWWPNTENPAVGPVKLSKAQNVRDLLLIDTADASRQFFALLESDIFSASAFENQINFNKPGPPPIITSRRTARPKSNDGFFTPWRVVLVGDSPGDLLESTVAVNLAAPLALEDASWIQAGKSLWNWRVIGYRAADGFTYGYSTASLKRFVDFAAANDIEYVLQDDFWWQTIRNGQITEPRSDFDMSELISYARSKGVDILIYFDRVNHLKLVADTTDIQIFELFRRLGGKGVKYGFEGRDVPFTRNAVSLAAEYQQVINFHDTPVNLTGARRTMPNAITREVGFAQQDARHAYDPTGFLGLSMVNTLSGPFDQTNGIYDLHDVSSRGKGPKNQLLSTVASENARTLVIFSGMIVIPDAPEEYNKKLDMFEFIRKLPATWDETKVLHSSIPNYISTARRSGEEWFVCSVTNETPRTLQIDMEFLTPGLIYDVTYYEDDYDHPTNPTHYRTNRETYQIREGALQSTETVDAVMVAGGGHCMWIRPQITIVGAVRSHSHWPFDSTADDIAGPSHGTMQNGASVTSAAENVRLGAGALALDGQDDRVSLSSHVADFPTGALARTVSGWFKPAGRGSQGHTFFDYGAPGTGGSFAVQADRSTVAVDVAGHVWGIGDLNLTDSWHHIAVTYPEDGLSSDIEIYLNGVRLHTTTLSGSPLAVSTGTTYAYVGHRNNGGYYNGFVDDLRVYEHQLNAAQVKAIFKNEAPLLSTPITSSNLNDARIVLTLGNGAYASTVSLSQVSVSGVVGVSIESVERLSDTQLVAALKAPRALNIVGHKQLTFTIAASALIGSPTPRYNYLEIEGPHLRVITDGTLQVGRLDTSRVVLALNFWKYTSTVSPSQVSVSGLDGVSIEGVERVSDTQLVADLAYGGDLCAGGAELTFRVSEAVVTRPGFASVALSAIGDVNSGPFACRSPFVIGSGGGVELSGSPVEVAFDDLRVSVESAGDDVVEGSPAEFVVTATPAQVVDWEINLEVSQTGSFAEPDDIGEIEVVVAANSGTAQFSVPTVADADDEDDGLLTATIIPGRYEIVSPVAASVAVIDDDPTAVGLSGPLGADVGSRVFWHEGDSTSTFELSLTLSRALKANEVLEVPLVVAGGVLGDDFSLALRTPAPDGVALSGASVTFTGSDANTNNEAVLVMTPLEDSDALDEVVSVSLPGEWPSATVASPTTMIADGAVGSGRAVFKIIDNDKTATPAVLVSVDTTSLGLFPLQQIRIAEGDPAGGAYLVSLATDPGDGVTVTVTPSLQPAGKLTVAPALLTYSGGADGDWATPQKITVVAVDDEDDAHEQVRVHHSVKGYQGVSVGPTLNVVVIDDDDTPAPDLVVLPAVVPANTFAALSSVGVELAPVGASFGGAGNLDNRGAALWNPVTGELTAEALALISLSGEPAGLKVVSGRLVPNADQNSNGRLKTTRVNAFVNFAYSGATITTDTTVTVTVDQALLSSAKDAVGSFVITALTPAVEVTPAVLELVEGGSNAEYTVVLTTDPGQGKTVRVKPASADPDAVTVSGTVFFTGGTGGDWSQAQTVTVTAVDDDDADPETVVLTNTVTGYSRVTSAPSVEVKVADDETALASVVLPVGGLVVVEGDVS